MNRRDERRAGLVAGTEHGVLALLAVAFSFVGCSNGGDGAANGDPNASGSLTTDVNPSGPDGSGGTPGAPASIGVPPNGVQPPNNGSGGAPAAGAGGNTVVEPATSGPAGSAEASGGGAVGGGGPVTVGGAGPSAGGANTGGNPPVVGGEGGVSTGGVSTGGAGPIVTDDVVTRSESTFTFDHFPIEVNSDFVWNGPASPVEQPTSTTYDTVILENGYLKVTLLPDYGGRVLSIVHKATNRELLYQNPMGAPYLMNEGIFYYDYLVIMGGIFPSFPEPEHGAYWNQPYTLEVISETDDAITVRMSRQDDLDKPAGIPERYVVPRTDILVEVDVTLRAGRSNLEIATKLTNTRAEAVPEFEYWTVTTLAPGSTPGSTAIPLNTRIWADMNQVHLLESSWAWFGEAEERVSDEIFVWNNLREFPNWQDQGTAFANPRYEANWSGLLNKDDGMGVVRVSDNVETPGLKLWTFGPQGLDIDLSDSDTWVRPTIEMWHGVTPEFWQRGSLAANASKQWTDNYFATLELDEVTAASEYGAVQLSNTLSGAEAVLEAKASLNLPDQTVHAVFNLDGAVVGEQDVLVASGDATLVSVTISSSDALAGTTFGVEFSQGERMLLSAQGTLQ